MSGGGLNGIGLCSPLAPDYAGTLAAYAAGEKRFRRDGALIGPDGRPLTRGEVLPAAEERDPFRRHARLLALAFEDLDAQLGGQSGGQQGGQQGGGLAPRLPVWLFLPSWLASGPRAARVEREWRALAQVAPGPIHAAREPAEGWLAALARACRGAGAQTPPEFLVAIADSALYAEVLDAMAARGRLLSRGQPHGLIPSEAAVIVRVTTPDRARAPRGVGLIGSLRTGHEDDRPEAPAGLLGRVLRGLWAGLPPGDAVDRLMIDLDGERWRAEEAAHVLSSHSDRLPEALLAGFETPPLTLGHCGVAGPALMLALALGDGPAGAPPDVMANGTGVERTRISVSHRGGARLVAQVARALPPRATRSHAAAPQADPAPEETRT
ncbi:hypothetical protein [Acidimangrovimonas sediminis]|uniref:hypothetical protein n=1 Tax=Acidimangrovimonas sediminis TaxID=2056283 RepID=UPI000C80EBF5|nr:hypothetical protein [Acidimangrovimonas sediminis]